MGDGGGGGDPGNRAQNVDTLLGKMLRIDVNGTTGSSQYRIPATNPYVGRTGRDEIWSRGLRNPWRFSFDRATGDLWIGDVGQGRYEEIDRATSASPATGAALNFGWRVDGGSRTATSRRAAATRPARRCRSSSTRTLGGAARSPAATSIAARPSRRSYGRYVFGDYCSGRIWTVADGGMARRSPSPADATRRLSISSFGEDERGELYVVDLGGDGLSFASSEGATP